MQHGAGRIGERSLSVHGRPTKTPEGLLFGQPFPGHEEALGPFDHLPIGQGLTQPPHLAESRDGEIEGGGQLGRAYRLDQARHHASLGGFVEEAPARPLRQQNHRTAGFVSKPKEQGAAMPGGLGRDDGDIGACPVDGIQRFGSRRARENDGTASSAYALGQAGSRLQRLPKQGYPPPG
jgi:hypothetical protein